MMKKLILLSFSLFIFLNHTLSQKLYIWCPKEQLATPRNSFLENENIDLVIFDGRILTPKSKVECTPEKTILGLANTIIKTYPSANITILDSEKYYKDPEQDKITIKIGIAAYHAAFGRDIKVGIGSVGGQFAFGLIPEGKWNAITAYSVKIYDKRNNKEIKETKDIYKIDSKPNLGGYSSAKSILNSTYIQANQEMFFFIDETLMK